jgi:hypothetical protein
MVCQGIGIAAGETGSSGISATLAWWGIEVLVHFFGRLRIACSDGNSRRHDAVVAPTAPYRCWWSAPRRLDPVFGSS